MNNFIPIYGEKSFNTVKKNTIKKLLQLEDGRFPTERINNYKELMLQYCNYPGERLLEKTSLEINGNNFDSSS